MSKPLLTAITLACYLSGALFIQAEESTESQALVLSKMGLMYVGGRTIDMNNTGGRFGGGTQTQIVEQAPVHYLIPPEEKRKGKLPVIMVPGMGLTCYLYLNTPDGRDGWAQLFAKAGHPVYVFDEPNNAVSGFDINSFSASSEEVGNAGFMRWANEMVWRRWGIGPEPGHPFADTQYPVDNIEQLYRSITPVFQDGGSGGGRGGRGRGNAGSNAKVRALVELLEKTGPAILILHSASGPTGFEAARIHPELIKAIVAVETTDVPTDSDDIREHFADIAFIGLLGDHFEVRPMAGRLRACEHLAETLNEADGQAEVLWLPKLGMRGNTHLMMQDSNNDSIANLLLKRLAGLQQPSQ